MEKIIYVFQLQGSLCILIGIGFYLSWKGLIGYKERANLSDLFINVFLPCNTVIAFAAEPQPVSFYTIVTILVLITVIETILTVAAALTIKKVSLPENRSVLQFCVISANAGMLGLPIVQCFLGNRAFIYAAIALLPIRIFMWSASAIIFASSGNKAFVKSVITHPCIIAVFIGLIIMAFRVPVPELLFFPLDTLSNCVRGISMLIMGSMMHGIDFKSYSYGKFLPFAVIRLFVIPLSIYLVLTLIGVQPIIIQVITVLFGMPAPFLAAIFAEKYNGNTGYAVRCVMFTTALSIGTIPVMMLIIC